MLTSPSIIHFYIVHVLLLLAVYLTTPLICRHAAPDEELTMPTTEMACSEVMQGTCLGAILRTRHHCQG